MITMQHACLLAGRILLGLYFIAPGLTKITNYDGMASYMELHNVPFIGLLLPLTIVLQIGLGAALIAGYKGRLSAFILAGLTLVISIAMHHFWDLEAGANQAHEMQNFIKNMGIMAGLLMVTGLGTGAYSVDRRNDNT